MTNQGVMTLHVVLIDPNDGLTKKESCSYWFDSCTSMLSFSVPV